MPTTRPSKTLIKEAVYAHAPGVVWAALTQGEAIAQWLMPNNLHEPVRVGTRFEFRIDPVPFIGACVEITVLEVEAPRRLVWSWQGSRKSGVKFPPMRIEWDLMPEGTGTRVRFTQAGLEGLPWIMRKMMTFGWGTMLKRWLPRVASAFEPDGSGSLRYVRIEKAPNRGHHGVKTLGPEYFK